MDNVLVASSSPHIRSEETVKRIMLDVIIALTPAMIGSIYFFGFDAFKLILISIISSVVFEALIQKALKKEIAVNDLSAVVTGILLAFNLPANCTMVASCNRFCFCYYSSKTIFWWIGRKLYESSIGCKSYAFVFLANTDV